MSRIENKICKYSCLVWHDTVEIVELYIFRRLFYLVLAVQGNNILGMGRQNLIKVTVDADCRMDLGKLKENLQVQSTYTTN